MGDYSSTFNLFDGVSKMAYISARTFSIPLHKKTVGRGDNDLTYAQS